MKILYWNVRGLGNQDTRLVLDQFCVTYKPEFIFLSEPWILVDQFPLDFWKRLKMKVFVVNNRNAFAPNLCGVCSESLSPTVIATFEQQVSLSILWNNEPIFTSAIYASKCHIHRRNLWFELATM